MGQSRVNLLQNSNMPFIFETHDGSPHIPDDHLLESEDILELAQRAFISKDTFKFLE